MCVGGLSVRRRPMPCEINGLEKSRDEIGVSVAPFRHSLSPAPVTALLRRSVLLFQTWLE
jgi:hypothetical protein